MSVVTIERVDTIALRIPYDHWAPKPTFGGIARETMDCLLLRVTASNGLIGWGEAFWGGWQATQAAIEHWVAPLSIGQDVADVGMTARFERALHNFGRSGPYVYALAGLDIALWDLRGKLAGVPVHALLGGRRRDRVAVYASLLQYNGDVERVRRTVDRALEDGFGHIKLHERTAAAAMAARDVAGPDIPLMVDANCAWLPEQATAAVGAMAAADLKWMEEPIWPPEDFAALAAVRRATGVATAIGENAGSPLDFPKMIAADCVDYVQPSVIKIGGLTPLWRITTEAEQAGVTCAPHSPFFGPGYLATVHVLAATARESALERFYCELAYDPCGHVVPIAGGRVEVPDAPGLGGDPDFEAMQKFRA